jgi:transcriptional regulator with XRE-family HTH domain
MNNSKEQTIFYAENLRYLRKKMGLTQSDVADKIGIHYKTLGNQEKGRHEPSIMYIKRYCDFFNVRAHLFLFTNIKENDNSFLNNSINKL